MKKLTEQELKTLREAEDILFNYTNSKTFNIFDNAFIELRKAINNYTENKGVLTTIRRVFRKEK